MGKRVILYLWLSAFFVLALSGCTGQEIPVNGVCDVSEEKTTEADKTTGELKISPEAPGVSEADASSGNENKGYSDTPGQGTSGGNAPAEYAPREEAPVEAAPAEESKAKHKTEAATLATAPQHDHEFTSRVTAEASCVRQGVVIYECACGYFYVEYVPIDRTRHEWEEVSIDDTTDIRVDGRELGLGDNVSRSEVTMYFESLGHSLSEASDLSLAFCREHTYFGTYTYRYCLNCGEMDS